MRLWVGCRGAVQGPGNQSASLDVRSHTELCGRGASAPVLCLRALGRLLPGQGGGSWGDKDLGPFRG